MGVGIDDAPKKSDNLLTRIFAAGEEVVRLLAFTVKDFWQGKISLEVSLQQDNNEGFAYAAKIT